MYKGTYKIKQWKDIPSKAFHVQAYLFVLVLLLSIERN